MKLAKNIALLPIAREGMGSLNLVLAWDDNHLVLIDAGISVQTDDIVKAISDQGHNAQDLTHIIITHQDWDHTGCVTDLQKLAPDGEVVGSNPVHTHDMAMADRSLRKIMGYDLSGVVAYHTGFLEV